MRGGAGKMAQEPGQETVREVAQEMAQGRGRCGVGDGGRQWVQGRVSYLFERQCKADTLPALSVGTGG